MRQLWIAPLVLLLGVAVADAGLKPGFKVGSVDLKSAGSLTFGEQGVLFIGDSTAAQLVAIDTGDTEPVKSQAGYQVKNLPEVLSGLLGTKADQVMINDLAVNPASARVYLSVHRGRGPDATALIVRLSPGATPEVLDLSNIAHARASLRNAPAPGGTGRRNLRSQTITDLAFIDGKVIVAGLSNEEFASKLRAIPFPFQESDSGTSVEIFHGAHGRLETRSPVRTFVPLTIGGELHVVAAYTCTPLVKFPVSALEGAEKVRGTTIAELGNRNNPLDMVVYKKQDKFYLLIANSARGVMKVTTDGIANVKPIENRVEGGGTAGLSYETVKDLKGVTQLDRLDEKRAVLLVEPEGEPANLVTIVLP